MGTFHWLDLPGTEGRCRVAFATGYPGYYQKYHSYVSELMMVVTDRDNQMLVQPTCVDGEATRYKKNHFY